MKLGFIGAGNMGGAILKGCVESGKFASKDIYVCDKDLERRKSWEELLLINTTEDIGTVVEICDIIIVGIKPDGFSVVMPEISLQWKTNKILVSMAAGIPISFLEGFLPVGSKVIRIMPNTPAMVREGMVSVSRNKNISNQDMDISMGIFRSVGLAEEVDESLIDCVIGVSGSSPAYTYLYIEALVEGATANGMEKEMATRFAAQSVLGAAKMVLETGVDPQQLCLNVCSPGGTTIEAVNKLKENGFKENVKQAFQAAVDKSELLSKKGKAKVMTFEEKTLETEEIYNGKILNLRRDKVTTVNGGTSYREIIEHSGGVVMAAITKDEKMVMIRQFRKAVEQVVFEAPAGKLELEEDIFAAAKRELKEETGYRAEKIEFMGSYFSSCGYTSEKLHIFLCSDLIPGDTAFDEHEALIVEEHPIKDLFQKVLAGEIDDAKTALAILLAYEKTK